MSMSNLARRQLFALLGEGSAPVLRVAGSKKSICFSCAGRIRQRAPVSTTTRQVVRSGNRSAVRYLSTGRASQKKTARTYSAVTMEAYSMEAAEEDEDDSHRVRPAQATKTAPQKLGPLDTYEKYVAEGKLRDDQFQRGIVRTLQNLHDELVLYKPPNVVHPSFDDLTPKPKKGLFASLFSGGKTASTVEFPHNTPKGLYLFGDVGCGKTMLMDLFYDTLPENIESKKRIHFHHFMQDVHKRLHVLRMKHGVDFDAVPFVAAAIADEGKVLCFDEFQCTDVADAMILRRLIESLMSHGVVIVSTSNRHPDNLYENGVQRQHFIPCIELLKTRLRVVPLDSPTDYRKVSRPTAGVYHHPLGPGAVSHSNSWFNYFGDENDPQHPESQHIWGREIRIPFASGRAARFNFMDVCGSPLSAADYLELTKHYDAFIVTDVPQMNHRQRDLARRFITFIDALYEAKCKIILTSEVPLTEIFVSKDEMRDAAKKNNLGGGEDESGAHLDDAMRAMMDDLGINDIDKLKKMSIFSGDEEVFAFARCLSRLTEMGSEMWVNGERK